MTDDQISRYVGMPYENGSYGPYTYNCWGLLVHIQHRYFKVEMPMVNIEQSAECALMFKDKVRSGEWTLVDSPIQGDAVLLRGGMAPHVGVFVNGGVLHALEDVGVVWTEINKLRYIGFSSAKYYRLK